MSKILKNKETFNFSIIVPDLNPVEEERFKFAFEKKQEASVDWEKELEKLKEEAIKQGFEEGYGKGYKEGLEQGYKQGYEQGYEKGYTEASKKAREEKEKEYQLLKNTLQEEYNKKIEECVKKTRDLEGFLVRLKEETEDLVLNLDKEVLDLAIKIAKKIVLKSINSDSEITLNVIKEALNYIAEGIEINIKLNPEEFEYVKHNLLKEIKMPKKINLIADESISKGGVLIETALGVIDATLEKRWNRVINELLKDEG